MTTLSLDYCNKKFSWLFSYLLGQSFSISFTDSEFSFQKLQILCLLSNFLYVSPLPLNTLYSSRCKENFYTSFRCHLSISYLVRTCIIPQSKIVGHLLFKNICILHFYFHFVRAGAMSVYSLLYLSTLIHGKTSIIICWENE